MRVLDVSLPLDERLVLFPGDPAPMLRSVSLLTNGDILNASELTINCHVGTHIDAPSHFLAEGADLSSFPASTFIGACVVVDLAHVQAVVQPEHLPHLEHGDRVLLKTRNSQLWDSGEFDPRYVYLSPEAAARIALASPRLVGFDYYSLDPADSSTFPSHVELARAGVPVLVAVDLRRVPAGRYTIAAVPLSLRAEACPVRAVLTSTST